MTEKERLNAAIALLRRFAAVPEVKDGRFSNDRKVLVALNGSWVWDESNAGPLTIGDFRQAAEFVGLS